MAKLTWKIWMLILFIVASLIMIFGLPPKFMQEGVLITSVESNSSSFEAGLRQGQIITSVDGKSIETVMDYAEAVSFKIGSNQSQKTILNTNDGEIIIFTHGAPEITVSNIPKTNIKTGLDLSGGARALIKAQDHDLTSSEVNDLVGVLNNRLNVYGISDVKIVPVSDLSGNNFVLIEIAGATPEDIEKLVSQQGKFEAKVGNETVFIGGERDIASVCRNDATCAGIQSCQQVDVGNYYCNFAFTVYLSENAAQKHADITRDLTVNYTSQGNYLSEKLDLYLDDRLVDSLLISEGLKGMVATQIQISGSGVGESSDAAFTNAEKEMKELQTILLTGSLPYKLEIIKLDTISPNLGDEFIRIILIAGAVSIVAVSIIVFFRYKKFKASLAILLTSLSEVIIILGIAAFIDWNLDLPSIAGILVTIGTGIDHQIIILDESKHSSNLSVKQKMKRAFGIIIGAYFTVLVSLLPLIWAGAGLFKGFAITTLIGITAGVLITRPAFTDIIRKLEE